MSSIDRLAQLNALHLYGMATAWSELLTEGPRRPVQPEAWIDRLIEAGVDALHPLQARAADMDAATLAARFKGRIAFLGGIDTQQLLVHGTPAEVRAEVERVRVKGVCDAIIAKREALISLGAHVRKEMEHDPRTRERQRTVTTMTNEKRGA